MELSTYFPLGLTAITNTCGSIETARNLINNKYGDAFAFGIVTLCNVAVTGLIIYETFFNTELLDKIE